MENSTCDLGVVSSFAMSSLDPLLSVGGVLLAIFGGLSLLTKRMHGIKPGTFAGRERVALTEQHTMQVVEIGGVRLLVGTGPGGAPVVLKELGEVEAPLACEVKGSVWTQLLARLGVAGGR